jgi:hypothetical protein
MRIKVAHTFPNYVGEGTHVKHIIYFDTFIQSLFG